MNMLITRVKIENFRIYKYQEFEFGENKLILLTGENGFGKTTLLDAIEWCLTGDIARLKKCYDNRNTKQNEKERLLNKKGIIKHSGCHPDDVIRVTITLKIDGKEINVYREQVEDSIYVQTKLKLEGEILPEIKDKVEKYINADNFYKYHVCDVFKTYYFLNNSRQEVKKEFEDFIWSYPLAESFADKLNELVDIIRNDIKKLEQEKTYENSRIKDVQGEVELIKSQITGIEYPQFKFYDEEKLSIEKDDIDSVKKQLENLKICGYNVVLSKIDDIISYYDAKEKIDVIDELTKIAKEKEKEITTSIKNSYYDVDKLNDIKKVLDVFLDEKQKIVNANKLSDIDHIPDLEIYSEIADKVKIQIDGIKDMEKKLKGVKEVINDKEKGNEIISALSSLVISREGILKYRNEGYKQCPLCGSDEKFGKISKATELATEAKIYLEKSKSDLMKLKKIEKDIAENLNSKFEQFKNFIIEYLDSKISILETQKTAFYSYYEKTKDFFEKISRFSIPIDERCLDKIWEIRAELMQKLSKETIIGTDLDLVKRTLTVLDYKADFENITVSLLRKIQLDAKMLSNNGLSVSNFTFDAFSKKLLFLNNILNNHMIVEKELQIENYKKKIDITEQKIIKLKRYQERSREIRDKIRGKKKDIEEEEMAAVGPYLYRIFTKIVKHTTISKFEFIGDRSKAEGGATFTDQSNNNILNILSQGQMSVFILSYFIGNMFKRKEETLFRTYFVDDITSYMDDMNVLTFVDIIKYQLYQKDGVINQFFFATCDSDLEKLFIHKMDSFNVSWTNIKFTSYASGEIHNKSGSQPLYFGN